MQALSAFVLHPASLGFVLWAVCLLQAPAQQRNVLVLVADDLGVHDVGAYGLSADAPRTPHIDQLAAYGVLFQNAWSAPICSPTRATIMTGRHGFRTGIGHLVGTQTAALPLSETTLPEMLDLGTGGAYAHALFGKWHLGNDTVGGALAPNQAGWGHFAGTLAGLEALPLGYFFWDKVVNGSIVPVRNYATSENVDDALKWIGQQTGPWVCLINFNAPHHPYHIPPRRLHSVAEIAASDSNRNYYKAMIEAVDTEIGRLLTTLGPIQSDTHIVFLGDNGTPENVRAVGRPADHNKHTLFQGGVRVPFIVSGPSVDDPGRESQALIQTTDLYATLADWTGVDLNTVPPLSIGEESDSVSLLPYLLDARQESLRDYQFAEIFRENGPQPAVYDAFAISDGVYKYIVSDRYPRHEPEALFHLPSDPNEALNLMTAGPLSPEAAGRLKLLRKWARDLRK